MQISSNHLRQKESNSIVKKYYSTPAAYGKQLNVTFYSLDMILTIGFSCAQ
ncbi:MAG: hypothetical protein IKN91_03945 [Paludibacteraceae bacterium]|nr:hypothetical protein [Paludibacteraceae bacterium]